MREHHQRHDLRGQNDVSTRSPRAGLISDIGASHLSAVGSSYRHQIPREPIGPVTVTTRPSSGSRSEQDTADVHQHMPNYGPSHATDQHGSQPHSERR